VPVIVLLHARDALVGRAAELADRPWDSVVRPPGEDPQFRETVFGPLRSVTLLRNCAKDPPFCPQSIGCDRPCWQCLVARRHFAGAWLPGGRRRGQWANSDHLRA
jgi:hypothetical protein